MHMPFACFLQHWQGVYTFDQAFVTTAADSSALNGWTTHQRHLDGIALLLFV